MIILDGPDSPDHESAIDTLYDKKRTNVTFNELVERIEVIDETPIKPQDYEEEDMNVRLWALLLHKLINPVIWQLYLYYKNLLTMCDLHPEIVKNDLKKCKISCKIYFVK